jgi:hypothetical protein
MERAKGIEPSYAAWEAAVLPLNYARMGAQDSQPRADRKPASQFPGAEPAGKVAFATRYPGLPESRHKAKLSSAAIGEIVMQTYQVQLWPNGRLDQQPWRMVAAGSEDEAVFKATGEQLSTVGRHRQIRARVMKHAAYGPPATAYYAA